VGVPRVSTEQQLRVLIETVRDYAIFLLDTEGRVMSWNAGARLLKGYTADEIIGQHISRFYPLSVTERGWPQHELKVASEVGRFEDEGWRVRKDGSTFWANVVITALRDTEGKLTGYAKITRDLTERRRNEEFLRQSEERFRLLVESVSDYAIFMLDPEGVIVSWHAKPSGAISRCSTRRNPLPWTGRRTSCAWPAPRAATRRKAGASARTAPGSGRTWC
jgi:PAS domain S-box-containing protein